MPPWASTTLHFTSRACQPENIVPLSLPPLRLPPETSLTPPLPTRHALTAHLHQPSLTTHDTTSNPDATAMLLKVRTALDVCSRKRLDRETHQTRAYSGYSEGGSGKVLQAEGGAVAYLLLTGRLAPTGLLRIPSLNGPWRCGHECWCWLCGWE
jgi:hypothetical protein